MIPNSIKLLVSSINPFLNRLSDNYSEIESIWLFGKRANSDYNYKSDWDLFVFGNDKVLNLLKADSELKIESEKYNIDLLVVFDGDNYKAPWKRPGEESKPYKEGCLKCLGGFGWSVLSDDEAEYTETKNVEGQEYPDMKLRKAYRILP